MGKAEAAETSGDEGNAKLYKAGKRPTTPTTRSAQASKRARTIPFIHLPPHPSPHPYSTNPARSTTPPSHKQSTSASPSFCLAGGLTGIGLLYAYYAACPVSQFWISLTLIVSLLCLASSLLDRISMGLLTPAFLFLYFDYQCWSAILSNPDKRCNNTGALCVLRMMGDVGRDARLLHKGKEQGLRSWPLCAPRASQTTHKAAAGSFARRVPNTLTTHTKTLNSHRVHVPGQELEHHRLARLPRALPDLHGLEHLPLHSRPGDVGGGRGGRGGRGRGACGWMDGWMGRVPRYVSLIDRPNSFHADG